MNRPVTIRHRFMRSGVFDLRRKVLMKNFMRSQKMYAEMYEDAISDNAQLVESQDGFPDNEPLPQESPETTPIIPETECPTSNDSAMVVDQEGESSSSTIEVVEQPEDDSSAAENCSGSKWKVGRKIRLKCSRKRRRSSDENPFADANAGAENPSDREVSVEHQEQMECDSTLSHMQSDTVSADIENKPHSITKQIFRRCLKKKDLLKRQYSFSRKTQCVEDYPRNSGHSSRVTRSMTSKPKNKGKRWLKVWLRRVKHNEYSDSDRTENLKKRPKTSFPSGLLKLRNSHQDGKNPFMKASSKAKRLEVAALNNRSVSVQTELTCFADVSDLMRMESSPRSKRFKRDNNCSTNCENSYYLRSSSHSRGSNNHLTSQNHGLRSDWNGAYHSHHDRSPGKYHKLTRSHSIQESSVSHRVNVCRRVQSVYVPNMDRHYLRRLHSCENIKVAA